MEPKNNSETKSKRIEQMIKIHDEALNLFKKKNADYGDSFATYGPIGVIVRMSDKIQRLISLSKSGIILVNSESLRDTLIDLHNYSAMAVMLIDEAQENKGTNENTNENITKTINYSDYIPENNLS